ncbi:MAG: deoxyribodipyrimidine photo-lyase [bacterium]
MSESTTWPVLLLLRRDLRLADNPALLEAARSGLPVHAVYVWPAAGQASRPGHVAAAWYLRNFTDFAAELQDECGLTADLLQGSLKEVFLRLRALHPYSVVMLNAGHDPPALAEEVELQQACRDADVDCLMLPANTLLPTGAVLNKDGNSFRVFTPYYKRFLERYRHQPPLAQPGRMRDAGLSGQGNSVESMLQEIPEAYRDAASHWEPGEQAARDCMEQFIARHLQEYGSDRHSLEISGTSRISAWLQAGVISTRQVWELVQQARERDPALADGAAIFQRQLIWREFAMQVLDDNPQLPDRPLQEKFAAFPWQEDKAALAAWQSGQTGFPVVDAAMRQLSSEGWMPGRARMVVASFLVKHLLQPWQQGEAWFADWLIDYDLSCNAFNWQWVAGCGTDAAPYFRIFNPILQGRKFDADGTYVRQWLPELADLPDKVLHSPWEASPLELQAAGVQLGGNYPQPIIGHKFARERALAALQSTQD